MEINKEQFMEWKEHPVTKEVFNEVNLLLTALTTQLVEGQTINYDAAATHGLTSRVVGQIDGLKQLLNISYEDTEDLNTEEDNLIEIER